MAKLVLLLTSIFGSINNLEGYAVSDANSLHTTLFTGYNTDVLPSFPVDIQSEYNLLTINGLDLKTQTLSTSGWFTIIWTDSRLSWTPASNGNIEYVYVAATKVWHPQLVVQNSADDLSGLDDEGSHVRIKYDGEVRWEPGVILSTACDVDVTYFPYDLQTCDIELASWGFHTDAVNLTFYKSNINLEDYRTNAEWELKSTSQTTSELVEDGLVYSELIFRIVLDRLPGYYIMSVIFPVILTAVLTSITFLLPVESGEKVGYILTVLLALAVLLTLFADSMPTTSKHTSVLVAFLTVTLAMASLVTIITILIIRLYHKPESYKAPAWQHKIARYFKNKNCKTNVEDFNGTEKEVTENGKKSYSSTNKNYYSNQELSEFYDKFWFVVFTILYGVVVLCFCITLSVTES